MAGAKSKKPQPDEEEDILSEDMVSAVDLFWKGTAKPNEPLIVSRVEDYVVRITNACLGPDANKNTRTSLEVVQSNDETADAPGIICTLSNNHENHQLNLIVTETIQLAVSGEKPSPIHLVGYLSPAEQYVGENPYDLGSDLEDIDVDEADEEEIKQLTAKKPQGAGRKRNLSEMGEGEPQDEKKEPVSSASKKLKTKDGQAKPTAPNQNKNQKNQNQNQKNQQNKKPEKPKEGNETAESAEAAKETIETKQDNKNPADDWKKGADGLKFKDIRPGDGKAIKKGSTVSVFYVGQLPNKKVFDKKIDGEGFSFKIGGGEVIQGWEKGLLGMKVGGKRRLLIPAKLAYGEEGSQPEIPPNTDLTFTIEVKSVN